MQMANVLNVQLERVSHYYGVIPVTIQYIPVRVCVHVRERPGTGLVDIQAFRQGDNAISRSSPGSF